MPVPWTRMQPEAHMRETARWLEAGALVPHGPALRAMGLELPSDAARERFSKFMADRRF